VNGNWLGYQTAVLYVRMGAKVYSVERGKMNSLSRHLFVFQIRYQTQDPPLVMDTKDYLLMSPFDSIIVTAGAPLIPKPLMAQLKIGGRLYSFRRRCNYDVTSKRRTKKKKRQTTTNGISGVTVGDGPVKHPNLN
jgi:protein-L-isoaspartate O-methyltransferase